MEGRAARSLLSVPPDAESCRRGLESVTPMLKGSTPALSDGCPAQKKGRAPFWLPYLESASTHQAATGEPRLLAPHLRVQLPSITVQRGSSIGNSEEKCGEKLFLSICFILWEP